jgi:hypothetical protein
VVVGIQMFTDSAESANVDQVSTELLQYAVAAQQYDNRPILPCCFRKEVVLPKDRASIDV